MTTYKEVKYDNTGCYVECANRDGSGREISSTYATQTDLQQGLATREVAGACITNAVAGMQQQPDKAVVKLSAIKGSAVIGDSVIGYFEKSTGQSEDNHTMTQKAITDALDTKQDALVSGTTIKTVNGNSLLGSGDITISGGGSVSRAPLTGTGELDGAGNMVITIMGILSGDLVTGEVKFDYNGTYSSGTYHVSYISEVPANIYGNSDWRATTNFFTDFLNRPASSTVYLVKRGIHSYFIKESGTIKLRIYVSSGYYSLTDATSITETLSNVTFTGNRTRFS